MAVRLKWRDATRSRQIRSRRCGGNENGEEHRSKPAPHLHRHPPPRCSRLLRSRRFNPVLSLHRWAGDGSNRNLIPRLNLMCLSNLSIFFYQEPGYRSPTARRSVSCRISNPPSSNAWFVTFTFEKQFCFIRLISILVSVELITSVGFEWDVKYDCFVKQDYESLSNWAQLNG